MLTTLGVPNDVFRTLISCTINIKIVHSTLLRLVGKLYLTQLGCHLANHFISSKLCLYVCVCVLPIVGTLPTMKLNKEQEWWTREMCKSKHYLGKLLTWCLIIAAFGQQRLRTTAAIYMHHLFMRGEREGKSERARKTKTKWTSSSDWANLCQIMFIFHFLTLEFEVCRARWQTNLMCPINYRHFFKLWHLRNEGTVVVVNAQNGK